MKHISKKAVSVIKLNEETQEVVSKSGLPLGSSLEAMSKKTFDNSKLAVFTESGDMFESFLFEFNKQRVAMPIANPVLIYYHSAYLHFRSLEVKLQD